MQSMSIGVRLKQALVAAALIAPALAYGAPADIAQAPLGTAPSVSVLPNMMYVLDDSGSMGWNYMPDNVNRLSSGTDVLNCRTYNTGSSTFITHGVLCFDGDAPFYAAAFNQIYYNPQITYAPGVNHLGVSLGNQSVTAALDNVYPIGSDNSAKNLTTEWPERVWCRFSSGMSGSDLTDPTKCRRNGVDTTGGAVFDYNANGFPRNASSYDFRYGYMKYGAPFYFDIQPREYCTNDRLVNCALQTAPTSAYPVAAPIRYCGTKADASSTAVVSGTTKSGGPRCTAKYHQNNYPYPRFGNFKRVNIDASTTFDNRPNRTDCAAKPVCSLAEEQNNFANWYTYYRVRMTFMKTATGRVFSGLDDRYRIGFLTINASGSNRYLPIAKFDATQKQNWFNKLYSMTPSGSTPLREALSRVGRHYAGVTSGLNSFMPEDPMQYSCQRNFTLLTTDGYWNSSGGQTPSGGPIGNQDNVDSGYSKRADGVFDGNLSSGTSADASTYGGSDTLADVALYYYKNDLRTSGPLAKNNVPAFGNNSVAHQHMVTFTLGLGVNGLMAYRSDYDTASVGDFQSIRSGATGCTWNPTGTCNWPVPKGNDPTAIDDLWHAAVSGRGKYFNASDPDSLEGGLSGAMNILNQAIGAAASAATSTPNITPTDNYIFSSTYRTVKWDGEIVAEKIDTTTGAVIPGMLWSARTLLNGRVNSNSDTRLIYTFDGGSSSKIKQFHYSSLDSSTERPYFDNLCVLPFKLPQCGGMNASNTSRANDGKNLVDFIRGQRHDEGPVFRPREFVLGDTANSKPTFVRKPSRLYDDAVTPSYNTFAAANASRQAMLYIGANDGMLHAFNADTGQEVWSYVPRMVFPELYRLGMENYDVNHRFYVDGSPSVADVYWGGSWKTILVGGLNSGGRGYYALDVTDPINPKGLWEFCHSSTLCAKNDNAMGMSFSNPIITKRASDGKWVVIVASGYNNTSPGDGKGYFYVLDAENGNLLHRISTGEGDTTTPSGLAKLTAFVDNPIANNSAKYVYGGDLLGNVWRLDLTTATPTVQKLAQLRAADTRPQSVTTRPEITKLSSGAIVLYVGTGRFLGSSDLPDPATLSPAQPWAYQQSMYAFKDTGADLGNLRSSGANLVQQTLSIISASQRTISSNPVSWSTNNGWYVDFNPANDSPGERVNVDPQLVRGTLVVATNEPNAEACNSGGEGWVYQFAHDTGSFVATTVGGVVGEKIAANSLIVGITVFTLPTGQAKGIAVQSGGMKTPFAINTSGANKGRRLSWRELSQD
jgi:type IV pilus assembly protein PilY1